MNNIIKLKINKKNFKNKEYAILQNFSLEVSEGETVAIVGESGVGKTSLLNILGLIDTKYQGDYHLFNTNVKNLNEKQLAQWRNKRIGFVLQEAALINSLSIEDNIKLPLLYANLEKHINKNDYFDYVVSKIGIGAILNKKPLECSGGQRSRAVLARAIIMQPQIILSDEPTSSLDDQNKAHIMDLLFELNKNNNATLITVTHEPNIAHCHQRMIQLERSE
ncbi:ABC-type lipoprotein export system ATPase subunit [Staphylococcus auricularis]|uniref:ABC transporter n=1 Tax=Staphylococcus auricularis TaxID=29379 RepID=A0AAP8TT86_9STAP|nr:ATP-binding cassette domain-containing protein [Staphylococcus auricularis]MBM0868727.1 ATP-binding cassette domain-containing protein [Staphylococcus auricularis]MCG7342493.1 ATP-binding cassette domain-containing protein [Staphylococcus auricularis]PNZ67731.1 ABC transporter [Staphylococcus auricularis]QPT05753.1 ATP-binding cassette domain-containing protein [Staphylococcus auricularis]SQJ07747.1 ABC transporter ATP-binding protein [Staphylococcus auricularis]